MGVCGPPTTRSDCRPPVRDARHLTGESGSGFEKTEGTIMLWTILVVLLVLWLLGLIGGIGGGFIHLLLVVAVVVLLFQLLSGRRTVV